MKFIVWYFMVIIVAVSCNNSTTNNTENKTDSIPSPINIAVPDNIHDSTTLLFTKDILALIKERNFKKIATYIHPQEGIRFSPYGYIDTIHDVRFSVAAFLQSYTVSQTSKINWGTYDGSGDTILLTPDAYFKKFVYDVDFLNAEKISVNKVISAGSSLNNIDSIYKNCTYTEAYFLVLKKIRWHGLAKPEISF